jgi:hypothetical protein
MSDRIATLSPVAFAALVLLSACRHPDSAKPPQAALPAQESSRAQDGGTTQPGQVPGGLLGRAQADIIAMDSAIAHYATNNAGRCPDDLVVLVTPDVNGQTYLGTRTLPKDPWGRDYLYDPPSAANGPKPRIYTLGRDGRPGGTGEDADVDSVSIHN